MKKPEPTYLRYAEVLPNGKGRSWRSGFLSGKRGHWVDVDPREIDRAVKRAIDEEYRTER